jgi:putative colanic acid biosynthesis glycosyltransferase
MRLLQINTTLNTGSTGRICEEIGRKAISEGFESYIAFSRTGRQLSESQPIRVGTSLDFAVHLLRTRLFDRHGFGSRSATLDFGKELKRISPDIIGLHNLHGYYLNIDVLFRQLKESNVPIVWTLHDCWAFTGHCTYFDSVGCERWKTQCHECPKTKMYPSSFAFDNSTRNYVDKKQLFTGLKSLTIVTPSQWLADNVKSSFLKNYRTEVIYNGVDLQIFRPRITLGRGKFEFANRKVILGVANIWDLRKGFNDFIKLSQRIGKECIIVLVGLNRKQISQLPDNIIGIERTENVQELADLYSRADVFVNPTYQDNFPTTNLEALASGTPVLTYNTGGSVEAIDSATGFVVSKGDIDGLLEKIMLVLGKGKHEFRDRCRARAVSKFNKEDRYSDYLKLYKSLLLNN